LSPSGFVFEAATRTAARGREFFGSLRLRFDARDAAVVFAKFARDFLEDFTDALYVA